MIAYTAWDSLQTIARQYDADLVLVPGERTAIAPRRERSLVAAVQRVGQQVRSGLTAMTSASKRRG